jgi:NTE family protein
MNRLSPEPIPAMPSPSDPPALRSAPTFAVAFGAGGARGYAHINVVEALDELGIRPTAIAGSSIGALVGACMAAGMSGREMREHCLSVLGRKSEVASRVWSLRPTSLAQAFQGGLRVSQFDVERLLKAFMPDCLPEAFEALAIPLFVTATDYYGHSELSLESGDLVSALAASSALPGLFQPIRRGGMILVDGGVYNPVPFDLLKGKADVVIGVDVVGWPEGDPERPAASAFDLLFGASQLMMQAIIDTKLRAAGPAMIIRPPVGNVRILDFLGARRIIEATESVKDEVKRAIDAAVAFA